MTESDSELARRAQIQIGAIAVDGFMLADGSYRMSLSQAAECIGLTPRNAFAFLQSKALKGSLGEDYTVSVSEIETEGQGRGQSRIRALPLEVVSIYWGWQAYRGNKAAFRLTTALLTESIERRFDKAFNVTRTEEERDQRLIQRIESLEQDIKGAMDSEASAQYELQYVRDWLAQRGLNPWELPTNEPKDD